MPIWNANEAYVFLKLVPFKLMDADRDILPIGVVVSFKGTEVDLGNDNRGTLRETVFRCVVGKGGLLIMIEPADKEC